MKVFLSCVSSEFKSYRLRLANQLGALSGQPFDVKVQEDFLQGGSTLLDALAEYIRDCDLVIHLVGEAAGVQPTPGHERTLLRHIGDPDTVPLPGCSYTQWEYRLARRLDKKVFVYIASPEAPRDNPAAQSGEGVRLQQAHIEYIRTSGEHRKTFVGQHSLIREVFLDLGLEPDRKVNNLPLKSLGTLFKGRDEFMYTLRAKLSEPEYQGHKRVAAITISAPAATVHGLGGIGKTRAAIEFAHLYADDYTALLFVRADSPEGLRENVGALCGPVTLDLPEQIAAELDIQVAAVLHWLQQHPGWLLILDNVDTEVAAAAVETLLGQLTSAGQVLITSRLSQWSGAVATVAMDVLSIGDASEFLLARTDSGRHNQPSDAEQAHFLAEILGQLPLALEQAGAMICVNRYTFAEYFEEWKSRHDRVLEWFDGRLMQYPRSVAVTWQTSFDQLTEPARELLNTLAWFAPDPIPESLLDVTLAEPDGDDTRTVPHLRDALAELDRYSLVTRGEAPQFSVHRLVQDVTRTSMALEAIGITLGAAINWLTAAFVGDPQDYQAWPTLDPLAQHVISAALHAADTRIASEQVSWLLNQCGRLQAERAQFKAAEELLDRALSIDKSSTRDDDHFIARDLGNIGQVYWKTNRLVEAEDVLRQALDIDSGVFGPKEPQVAFRKTNLAFLLHAAGKDVEAERILIEAFNTYVAHDISDDPRLASCCQALARIYIETERSMQAERLLRQALYILDRLYEPYDPRLGECLGNLAQALIAVGDAGEAEPYILRVLSIYEKSYGPLHPRYATQLNNLGRRYVEASDFDAAEPLFRRALKIMKAAYGLNSPELAVCVSHLGLLKLQIGRTKNALGLLELAFKIDSAAFPQNHPRVSKRFGNLALALVGVERFEEAREMMRQSLEILVAYTSSSGHIHRDLEPARMNFEELLSRMGVATEDVAAELREIAPELSDSK